MNKLKDFFYFRAFRVEGRRVYGVNVYGRERSEFGRLGLAVHVNFGPFQVEAGCVPKYLRGS